MADMMAVAVDPNRVSEVWPHFGHWIERAIARVGLNRPEAVAADVLAGRSLLWLAYDGETVYAAAVTELRDGICEIVACGGSGLNKFLPCIASLEQFARDEGCKGIRIIGRKGWQRVLDGYEQRAVILEKAL